MSGGGLPPHSGRHTGGGRPASAGVFGVPAANRVADPGQAGQGYVAVGKSDPAQGGRFQRPVAVIIVLCFFGGVVFFGHHDGIHF